MNGIIQWTIGKVKMMRKFFCMLGFHAWHVWGEIDFQDGKPEGFVGKFCPHCGIIAFHYAEDTAKTPVEKSCA